MKKTCKKCGTVDKFEHKINHKEYMGVKFQVSEEMNCTECGTKNGRGLSDRQIKETQKKIRRELKKKVNANKKVYHR